jgi:hypothetical protein
LKTGRAGSAGDILAHVHGTGHEGTEKAWHQLRLDFHVSGARTAVRDFVYSCLVYQKNKTKQLQLAGLLQPLVVPTMVWADIALDFAEEPLQRGPGPRPSIQFKYNIRTSIRPYLYGQSITGENVIVLTGVKTTSKHKHNT